MVLQSKSFRKIPMRCPGRLTDSNLEHPMKELTPKVVMEGEMATEVSEVHPANAES